MSELKDFYAGIIEKLDGGRLLGELIDLKDPKEVVVAAYFLGQHDAIERQMQNDKFMDELMSKVKK